MNFATVNVSNSFLDRANENLTQLSTSCSVPPASTGADSSQLASSRQHPMSSSAVDDHNSLPSYHSQFPPLNVNGFGAPANNNISSTSHLSYGNALSNGEMNNHTATSSPFGSSSYINGTTDSGDAQIPLSLMETTQVSFHSFNKPRTA